MFQFLTRNTSVNYILLPILVLFLWGDNLLAPQFVTQYYDLQPMLFYQPLVAIQLSNPLLGQIVLLVFVLINILLLVRINLSVRLIEKRSLLFMLLLIFFSASLQIFKQMNPLQPAMTFIIVGMYLLLKMYKEERDLRTIFESGVCFSIASFFYAPAIFLCPVVFVGLMLMVPFYWRQWMSAIIGVALPIVLLFSISYCNDTFFQQLELWEYNLQPHSSGTFNNLFPIMFSFYLGALFILSFIYAFWGGLRKIFLRKVYVLFFCIMVIILLLSFFSTRVGYEILFFGLLPTSIYISNYMLNIKRKVFVEILFDIILIFVILVQIFPDIVLG